MSLMSDLSSLDLGAVVNARASISVAVDSPQLKALLEGKGLLDIVLGDLGTTVDQLDDIARDPTALVKPIADALGKLGGAFEIGDLPLAEYASTVEQGVTIVTALLKMIGGDPANIGKVFGVSLGDLMGSAGKSFDNFRNVGPDGLVQMNDLFKAVDSVPHDAAGFATLALEALSPFPRADLARLHDDAGALGGKLATLALPAGRTQGLVAAFDAVAAAPDAAALQRALAALDQVRGQTVENIASDVGDLLARTGALGIEAVLGRIAATGGAFRSTEEGLLGVFDLLRQNLAGIRGELDGFEPKSITDAFALFSAKLQQIIDDLIIAPIEEVAGRMEVWARELLAHLPLRALRAELGQFIHRAADAVADAGIDRYAGTIREQLGKIKDQLQSLDIAGKIKDALGQVEAVMAQTLDAISSALDAIKAAIDGVADAAKPIVEKVVDLLSQFRQLMEGIKATLAGVSIQAATDQVVGAVRELRQKAEDMFQSVNLPEPARPLVDQLIKQLEGIDIRGALLGPVKKALEDFDILKELKVEQALTEARKVIGNLIPSDLAKTLEAEVGKALEIFQSFDVTKLTGQITAFFDDLARTVEGVATGPLIDVLRTPFKLVLAALDKIHPRNLLAPVIELYDHAMAGITFPGAEVSARQFGQLIGAPAAAAASNVSGGRMGGPAPATAPGGPTAPAVAAVQSEVARFKDLRPGDFVRFLGYVPRKLREALDGLDAGAAGELVRAVDARIGGLARALRAIADQVAELPRRLEGDLGDLLAPVGEAQARAQLAVRFRFQAGGGGGGGVGSRLVLAQAGPGPLAEALDDRLSTHRASLAEIAVAGRGNLAVELGRVAALLESSPLGQIGGDLDRFLAALDPEPIAAEIDAICGAMLRKVPAIIAEAGDEMQTFLDDLRGKIVHMNPLAQAQRFLRVFDVLKEEINVLNPASLVDDLAVIHAALVEAVSAYDPAAFSAEIAAIFGVIGDAIRALDPSAWLKPEDFAQLTATVARVADLVPTQALASAGTVLAEASATLQAIDIDGLLEEVRAIPERITGEVEDAAGEIADEVLAFLESLKFVAGEASVSVSVGGGS
jgi:uncharacterized protein YjbJ (UPF0337 family)